jgi:hypothetical protein
LAYKFVKLYDKYDRELFLDMQHTAVVKQNTLIRRFILWIKSMKLSLTRSIKDLGM